MPRTILFAWELGGGLGHLAPVTHLLGRLLERGYRVVLAARDLSRARTLVGRYGVELLQAPIKTAKTGERIDPLRSFAHILHNCGFADFDEFAAMAEAWRHLFEYVHPDLVLCDHAPIALLVARAMSTTSATIGTGFCCPPDVYPMPDFRPWLPDAQKSIQQDEDWVTGNINRLLGEWKCDPIDRLGRLYGEVDECFLTTFRKSTTTHSGRVGVTGDRSMGRGAMRQFGPRRRARRCSPISSCRETFPEYSAAWKKKSSARWCTSIGCRSGSRRAMNRIDCGLHRVPSTWRPWAASAIWQFSTAGTARQHRCCCRAAPSCRSP